jgi:cell division protein FtsA
MTASRLEINVHLVTASHQEHTALVAAVNHASLSVDESVFEALAACYAAVMPEDRREGVAVVDIGSHSTELVVYYGDSMHLASTVRVCGYHFTRDVAQGLCLSFDEAEMVKREYGCAVASSTPENILIELPTQDNREPRQAQRRLLNRILEARAQEMFGFVRNELARVGMEHALIGGVFLTGGGAMLPDMCDVAEQVLQCQTRYGLPVGIQGWPEELNDPSWATAAGLAMYSAKLKMQTEGEKRRLGPLARMLR